MPQTVRRIGAVWFSILISFLGVCAQTSTTGVASAPAPTVNAPTSADIMRARIKKAKALVAVKNYNAAIYELEGIRRETNETAVTSVAQVMLMNCYLEQSDYKRAQALLTEMFNAKKTNRFGGENYYAVAGQVVRGAKVQSDRYKSLGLMVSDPNLPPDAVADINKMRETVEMVIAQSKTLGAIAKETPNAMALLEEATGARGNLARDDFDAKRWKDEVADARDGLVNQRGVIDATGGVATSTNTIADNNANTNSAKPLNTAPSSLIPDKTNAAFQPVNNPVTMPNRETAQTNKPAVQTEQSPTPTSGETAGNAKQPNTAPPQNTVATNSAKSVSRVRKVENSGEQPSPNIAPNNAPSESNAIADSSPLPVGSLLEYATAKVNPTYPAAAKTMRTVGTVRVDLIVDEDGKPEIQDASGPGMLKQAAQDAVKRWKFKPFTRDGQPVKASGYVNFNFNL